MLIDIEVKKLFSLFKSFFYLFNAYRASPFVLWHLLQARSAIFCGCQLWSCGNHELNYRKLANKSHRLSLYKPQPSCGYYSRAAFIRNGIQSNFMQNRQAMRLLFKGGFYSRAAFIGEFTVFTSCLKCCIMKNLRCSSIMSC